MLEITEKMILEGIGSKEFIQVILEAVRVGNISVVDSFINLFSEACYKNEGIESFPEDVFEVITKKMKDEDFQSLPDSHKLLYLFESDWGRLNDLQKSTLLKVINDSYLLFEDELSYFVLSEIIGEYFADEKALKIFDDLRQTENETARSFLTYGYGKLAQNTNDENVRRLAIARLQIMKKDNSAFVKEEAIKALSKFKV